MPLVHNTCGTPSFTRALLLLQRLVLIGIAIGTLSSCAAIKALLPAQREATHRAEEIRVRQLEVMRFADEYSGRVLDVTTHYQMSATTPEDRLYAQEWKLQQSNAAYTIASGPDGLINAVDMAVLATLSRMVIEDLWTRTARAERVRPMKDEYEKLEQESWELLRRHLTDPQIEQVRDIIVRWRKKNPGIRTVGFIHFSEIAKSIGIPSTEQTQEPGSLFSLIGIDPFTSLDPAVREVTKTRALAERALYYVQRMPRLVRMETQELLYQMTVLPEAKSALAALDRASLIGSTTDQLAKSLPEVLSQQREALVSQILQELDNRRATVTAVSGDIRSTLQAGTNTANAVHATVDMLDRMIEHEKVGQAPAGQPSSHPFDVREYTQMLQQLDQTARELNTATRELGGVLPAVRTLVNETLDRLFLRIILLVFVCLLALLAYHALATRISRVR
jgi:hypothetical protein